MLDAVGSSHEADFFIDSFIELVDFEAFVLVHLRGSYFQLFYVVHVGLEASRILPAFNLVAVWRLCVSVVNAVMIKLVCPVYSFDGNLKGEWIME